MPEGIIIKALSGFYYVKSGTELVSCRARGKFRLDGTSPLAGDRVAFDYTSEGEGCVLEIQPRKNFFVRPAVANVDFLVLIAANTNPVTDPYLVDRVAVIAESVSCGVIVCINKVDVDRGDELFQIYSRTGYKTIRTSAKTGEGIGELRKSILGKTVAFTGNSGVGKSSILNAVEPRYNIATGEVSERLGRGRHTTRHVEFFDVGDGTYIADTPGFSSFDLTQMSPIKKEELQDYFPELRPLNGTCRFDDCMHRKEPGCSVTRAVGAGEIHPSRYESYTKLFEIVSQFRQWENPLSPSENLRR